MKPVLFLAAIVIAFAASSSAATKPPGTVVAKRADTGSFAIAVAHGQVARPKALYVRAIGKVTLATILVECLAGGEPTGATYVRRRAGLHPVPVKPKDAALCHVTATIYGSGRIVAEIRVVR
jgi:hypothetical protein